MLQRVLPMSLLALVAGSSAALAGFATPENVQINVLADTHQRYSLNITPSSASRCAVGDILVAGSLPTVKSFQKFLDPAPPADVVNCKAILSPGGTGVCNVFSLTKCGPPLAP